MFRRLNEVQGPDLTSDVQTREPRAMPGTGTGRRVAAVVALTLAVGGGTVAARAFFGGARPVERMGRPAQMPAPGVDPVVDVTLPIRWPSSVAYGEGSIWVSASANDGTAAGTIYRIDPDTTEVVAEIPSPVVPGWETGGGAIEVADGDVWVAGGGAGRDLVQIDSATNQAIQEIAVDGDFLSDVAVDERGVWVSAFSGGGIDLVRLDPVTGQEEARFPMESSYAREVLAVEGTIWLHERRTRDSDVLGSVLSRVDPETGIVMATAPLHGGAAMVTEGDGYIWAPTWTPEAGNLLLRVDPHTGEVVTLPSENLEFVIAVGEGGIWGVARRGQDLFGEQSGIVRFDPLANRVDAGIGVEGGPIAMAVAPGSVWVVHYKEGVTRIELRPL